MKRLLFFLFSVLVLSACRDDLDLDSITTIDPDPPVLEVDVKGDLAGRVIDEAGQPIEGAYVRVGNVGQLSDEDGLFQFQQIDMNGAGTLVKVYQAGFFDGSTRIYPRDASDNFLTFRLLQKEEIGRIDGNAGGRFTSPEGLILDFPPNSIVDTGGVLYTGQVRVLTHWIDPARPDLTEVMPGNQEAENAAGELVSLLSYGMVGVELVSEGGVLLNLGNGQTAQITFPLGSAHLASAPAQIPLWYYDEDSGLWREEGSARLEGNAYRGEVSHFSFWNCDVPYPLALIEGRILIDGGKGEAIPLADTKVRVRVKGLNATRCGYTDAKGYFRGKVPVGEELELGFILFDECSTPIQTFNIPPLLSDTDLGTFEVVDPVSEVVLVEGQLMDCDDNPLDEGWLKVPTPDLDLFYHIPDGILNLWIPNCDNANELTIIGIDRNNRTEGDPQTQAIVDRAVDFGPVPTCENDLTEFFRITVNGEEKDIFPVNIQALGPTQLFFTTGSIDFQLTLYQINGGGTYDHDNVLTFALRQEFQSIGTGPLSTGCSGIDPECLELTEIILDNYTGTLGEIVRGSFSGTVDVRDADQTMFDDLPFSAEFAVPVTN
ncbi:MAG: carboxypeptidase-like regulatory domain-containing protein [Bacteroidota bacterium]